MTDVVRMRTVMRDMFSVYVME